MCNMEDYIIEWLNNMKPVRNDILQFTKLHMGNWVQDIQLVNWQIRVKVPRIFTDGKYTWARSMTSYGEYAISTV